MSLPGWYPDPAGAPNRFRYWNGQTWSHEVTDDPAGTAPAGATSPPPARGGGSGRRGDGRRFGPLILALVAVVVLLLATVLVLRSLSGEQPVVQPGPLPSATVSGWDDGSQTAAPETPTPQRPTLRPSPTTPSLFPTPSEEQPVQPCPVGQPTARQDHPADGRIHGGGLSFPEVPGWQHSSGAAYSWAYDVGEQVKLAEEPRWYANLAVGALFTGDGFDEPRRAAELVMQCMVTSGLYPYFTDRQDVWSRAVTVDGRPGWSVRADIEVDDPELSTPGDTVDVIVVDTGSPESLAMFIGAVDIGNASLQRTLTSTIAALKVD